MLGAASNVIIRDGGIPGVLIRLGGRFSDIKIEGDSSLSWGEVVKVMDICTRAGFRPGFAAPPDRGVGQK